MRLTAPSTAAGRMAFFGAIALGIAVRAVDFLNCRSLGLDEARLAVNVASRSLFDLLRPLDLDQAAPPLFLWGERLVFQLLGHSDCGLRLLPVVAGTAAVLLLYPLALRFVTESEARLAATIGIFSPLLITYSNAVKQYSIELLAAVLLLLLLQRAFRSDGGRELTAGALAAGAIAPWVSLSSVFVLAAAWLVLATRAIRRQAGAVHLSVWSGLVWGMSGVLSYALVYRAAGRSAYMQRFWELAFLNPARSGFLAHAWKTVEDQVWGFVAGDPLVDRGPFLAPLHLGSGLALVLVALGCRRVMRTRGRTACWWLVGPVLLTVLASMLGLFPIAPRLTLFLLPGVIVLFVAGVSDVLPGRALAPAAVLLVLPLATHSIVRTFELEPSRHFQRLVRELEQRRLPGEPVYLFARTLPAWIYYSTDWSHPDTARLRYLMNAARAGGPAFENAPSRARVSEAEARLVQPAPVAPGELLGLPSGMEWREVEEHSRERPDSGWVEIERRRIEEAAAPGIWVLATAWYEPESELFKTLERDASRRTFALLRGGSALVRYEFGRGDSSRQSGSSARFGRRKTATMAGR